MSAADPDIRVPHAGASQGAAARVPSGRIPELDGLRGLAILMVVAKHYTGTGPVGAPGSAARYLHAAFSLGWSGVDLFFVLSGFLIGGILLDARDSPRYFLVFYLRRVHRILPIYVLVVLIYGACAFVGTSHLPEPLHLISPGVWFFPIYLLFLQNMWRVPSTIFGQQFLAPLWSLAVEEQFYLVAPLLIRLLSRRNLMRLLLTALLAAPLLRVILFHTGHFGAMYELTAARADALALGVLLAIAWRTPRSRNWLAENTKILGGLWLALLAIILAIAASGPEPRRMAMATVGFSVLALFFGTTLLLSLLNSSNLLSHWLRIPVLRHFGTISYCLYLIHDWVNPICHWLLRHRWAGINTPVELLVTLVSFAAAWGLARVSWVWFEKPLVRRGHRYSY